MHLLSIVRMSFDILRALRISNVESIQEPLLPRHITNMMVRREKSGTPAYTIIIPKQPLLRLQHRYWILKLELRLMLESWSLSLIGLWILDTD